MQKFAMVSMDYFVNFDVQVSQIRGESLTWGFI